MLSTLTSLWLTRLPNVKNVLGALCGIQVTAMQPSLVLDKSTIKYVVILTYQRCGSSFFGNIFNLNPDAFYAYEPLDSLYSSLYGTTPGWNIPSDIANNANGSARCETLNISITDSLM